MLAGTFSLSWAWLCFCSGKMTGWIEWGYRHHSSSPGYGTLRANLGISSNLTHYWFQTITPLLADLCGTARHRWALGCARWDISDGKGNSCRRGAPASAYFPRISMQQSITRAWTNPTIQFQRCLVSGRLICRHSLSKKAPDPSIYTAKMQRTGCKTRV